MAFKTKTIEKTFGPQLAQKLVGEKINIFEIQGGCQKVSGAVTQIFPQPKKDSKQGVKRLVIGCYCVENVNSSVTNIVLTVQGTI